MTSVTENLALIGGITVIFSLIKLCWKCCHALREFLFSKLWHEDLRTYGEWAVITGATSGIGEAYACELARRGLNVVLVSRSEDKLQRVSREIGNKYRVKTRTLCADFTEGENIYPSIAQQLQGLTIGILVNNVGMTQADHFACFLDFDADTEKKITKIINCNMLSVAQMSRLVLPGMVKREKGLIINMSSIMGIRPQPLLTLYSATKVFVTYFSQCLHAEYKSKGITVQCVAPSLVSTNMTRNIKVNFLVKSASAFAREALNTVGHSSFTNGCLSHALQNAALSFLLPDWLRMSTFLIRKQLRLAEQHKGKMMKALERRRSFCGKEEPWKTKNNHNTT
ncbi:hydroxysteroid (20-beta) dehydrogenase 2 [Gouania willdenowi]|uniref:hydroxysteroid (20-beta) dehydrogenase 2 n=1 Tax=Gouania willdenowi TaxID=441366 RepID=UPI001055B1F9|nr:very-long-chain 3-oxoacyl-CoA reductase-like [Gouania willdenowi]